MNPAAALSFPPPVEKKPTRQPLRQDIQGSMVDGGAYSLMVGLGETYVPAFILAVGLGEVNSGLITTVPVLVGAVFQLLSAYFVKVIGSYRRWIVLCAAVQSLTFLPLAVAAFFGYLPASAAFLCAAIYWGMGMSISSVWNSWIANLVPGILRTSFLARRNRLTQFMALVGFLLGGLILQRNTESAFPFAFLFIAAFLSRGASAYFLSRQSETPLPEKFNPGNLRFQEVQKLASKQNPGGMLLLYLLALQFSVHIAAPYFTPYMLSDIRFDYREYVFLIAAPFAVKVLGLPWLGRCVKKHGPYRVMWIAATGIALFPAGWTISKQFGWVLFLQSATGLCWAAHELVTLLLVIEYFKEEERIRILSFYNVLNATLMTVASLLGASLLDGMGKSTAAYYTIFLISSVGRLGTLYLMSGVTMQKLKKLAYSTVLLSMRVNMGYISPLRFVRSRQKPRPGRDDRKAA